MGSSGTWGQAFPFLHKVESHLMEVLKGPSGPVRASSGLGTEPHMTDRTTATGCPPVPCGEPSLLAAGKGSLLTAANPHHRSHARAHRPARKHDLGSSARGPCRGEAGSTGRPVDPTAC